MTASRILTLVATVALSGATGWVLNDQWRKTGENAAQPVAEVSKSTIPAPSATPSSGPAQTQPAVTLFGDGTMTVNFQHRTMQWLVDEIARQNGGQVLAPAPVQDAAEQAALNRPKSAACKDSSALQSEACEKEQELQTLQAIREGDEKARYEGLQTARSHGLPVPQETLKALYQTDTSERVRLLAFQQYVDVVQEAGIDETRATLQAALSSPSAAIQTEAKRLLDELEESEADQ